MSEQEMATYTLTIQADSGYESTTEGRCTAEQYGQAMAALHGTSPAPRPWVGLTHDEYDAICDKHSAMSDFDFLADIQAKLREKNQ